MELKFAFDLPAVNLILEGLGKLPLERSMPLFDAIRNGTQQQIAQAEAEKAKADAEGNPDAPAE